MPCGVSKTMANGALAVCDNLGAPSHTGLHSALTTEFWFNWGRKVRVYWSSGDTAATRQKPIIRGDFFEPLAENEIPPPGGVVGRSYVSNFNDVPDVPGNIGSDWQQALGPATARVSNGIVVPGNLGSNTGKTTWAFQHQGGDNNGRLDTDNYQIQMKVVPSAVHAAATDMSCSILMASSDTWGSVFECALFTGQTIKFIYNNAVRATSTYAGTTNRTYTLRRVGNLFTLWADTMPDPILEWNDSTAMVPKGATNRRWGFSVQSNFPLFQQQYDSHGVDWITAEDYA